MKVFKFIFPALLTLAMVACSGDTEKVEVANGEVQKECCQDDKKCADHKDHDCTDECKAKCEGEKHECKEDCKDGCTAHTDADTHECSEECIDGCTAHADAHECTEECKDGCKA